MEKYSWPKFSNCIRPNHYSTTKNDLNAIAFNNGNYVVVGDYGTIMRTPHNNTVPLATAGIVSTFKNSLITGDLSATDLDLGTTFTYTKASNPQHGTVTVTNEGYYVYTPDLNYVGTDGFTFTVNDDVHTSAPAQITISILAVVDTPTTNPTTGVDIANNSNVILNSTTSGATIYYTTDETIPNLNSLHGTNGSSLATVAIIGPLGSTITINSLAVAPDKRDSNIALFTYTILKSDSSYHYQPTDHIFQRLYYFKERNGYEHLCKLCSE